MADWIDTIGLSTESIQKLKTSGIRTFDAVSEMTWIQSIQLLGRSEAWILREAYDPILPND